MTLNDLRTIFNDILSFVQYKLDFFFHGTNIYTFYRYKGSKNKLLTFTKTRHRNHLKFLHLYAIPLPLLVTRAVYGIEFLGEGSGRKKGGGEKIPKVSCSPTWKISPHLKESNIILTKCVNILFKLGDQFIPVYK